MKKSRFEIYQAVWPETPIYRVFRILETYPCANGWRTRIVDPAFASLEEAQAFVAELEKIE